MGANASNSVVPPSSLVKNSENQLVEEVLCLGQLLATLNNDVACGVQQVVWVGDEKQVISLYIVVIIFYNYYCS